MKPVIKKCTILLALAGAALMHYGFNWEGRALESAMFGGIENVHVAAQHFIDQNVEGLTTTTQARAQVKMMLAYWDRCHTDARTEVADTVSGCGNQTICFTDMGSNGDYAECNYIKFWSVSNNAWYTGDWNIKFNQNRDQIPGFWQSSYNGGLISTDLDPNLLLTGVHEWGHALGSYENNSPDYVFEVMRQGTRANRLTEDTCEGAYYPSNQGTAKKYMQFRVGAFNYSTGFFNWELMYVKQGGNDWKSMTTPSITGIPGGSNTGKFVVSWVNAYSPHTTRWAVMRYDYVNNTIVVDRGPVEIANSTTLDQPSVIAYDDNILFAIKDQWKDNTIQPRESRIRLHYYTSLTDTTPTNIYPVCHGNSNTSEDWCTTLGTPKITYNPYRSRYVLAWVAAPSAKWNNSDNQYNYSDKLGMFSIYIMVSAQNDPTTWLEPVKIATENGFPEDSYGSPLNLALTCENGGADTNACMLIYNRYNTANVWDEWELEFTIGSSGGISYISNSWRNLYDANYGDRDVVATPFGWMSSYAPHLNEQKHNFWYRFKSFSGGISGSWDFDERTSSTYKSYWGFDLAYIPGQLRYIVSWIDSED